MRIDPGMQMNKDGDVPIMGDPFLVACNLHEDIYI
jgi:hypothetical protein